MLDRFRYFARFVLVALLIGGSVQAQNGRFRFAPPDSVRYSITVVTSRLRAADTMKPTLDSAINKAQGLLVHSPTGFRLVERNESLTMRRDGQAVEDPMLKLLTGLTLTTELDSLGFATAVHGYEAITARIDSSMPPQQAEAIKRVVKPEAVADRDLDEWNRRMMRLVGRRNESGTLYFDTSSVTLPNGQNFLTYTVTRMIDTVTMGKEPCIKIVSSTDLTPEGLSERSNVPMVALMRALPGLDSTKIGMKPDAELHAHAETIVELGSLLIRGETSERQLRFFMLDRANKKVPMRMDETTRKTYTYTGR